VIRAVGQIGVAVLVVGILSCNSSPAPTKPALPKDENGNDCQCRKSFVQGKFTLNAEM
jgi:hypothetical protein